MKEIAIKQRFYPTSEQVALLEQTFGCVRYIYNSILRWRTDAFYNENQKVNYNAASSRLTELKKDSELSWLNDVSCVPLQQSLRHQQTAFKNFFEGRAKYPAFKGKRIHLEIHDLGGLDVTSPTGQMVVSVLGSVAQMQREQTLEKTRIGIERAKAEGKFKGKQVSEKTLKAVEQAKAFIEKGLSKPQAAKAAGIGVMTLYRHLNGSYQKKY